MNLAKMIILIGVALVATSVLLMGNAAGAIYIVGIAALIWGCIGLLIGKL